MLFWAEGSKGRNTVGFVNSAPAMIKFFVQFLRTCYAVPEAKIAVTCNLFVDHEARQREIEDFWLRLVGVSRARLRKTTVNRYSKYSTKKRQNKLPLGLPHHRCDTRLVHNIYGAIQEYGGFEREEWVM